MDFYAAMRERFGHRGWWPGDGRLEICVGAILTQNTNWKNVEKAVAAIRAADVMDAASLLAMDTGALAALIRPAGYYNVKAKRLRHFLSVIVHDFRGDIDAFLDRPVAVLREELLGIHGIGPETADSIILYAAGRPSFVVDAYTRRLFLRHGLIGEHDGYDDIKRYCESRLPEEVDLWNDFHAQIVETGKRYCRVVPRCDGCPLACFPHVIEKR